jgi:hypothetical protein
VVRGIVIFCFLVPLLALAVSPPPPYSLEQNVQRASHVFVGRATGLRVIECKTGQEIVPAPKDLELGQCIELQMTLQEVLSPSGWSQKEPLKVRHGGGFFSVKRLQKELLNQTLVYLTTKQDSYFVASYPWQLTEPLEKKSEIQGILNGRSRSQDK